MPRVRMINECFFVSLHRLFRSRENFLWLILIREKKLASAQLQLVKLPRQIKSSHWHGRCTEKVWNRGGFSHGTDCTSREVQLDESCRFDDQGPAHSFARGNCRQSR